MRKHKYFRNQDYRRKLDHKANAHGYFQDIVYLTKEKDTAQNYRWFTPDEPDFKGYFSYYHRPKVAYIVIHHPNNSCWRSKRYYKRYSNRMIRRTDNVYSYNNYRRHFDLWWTVM